MTNSIMIDIDDPRSAKIGEIIGNKSARKILSLLSDREMSVGDIASSLKLPVNTVMYNVEKLVSTGLVEKGKKSFWSVKGKKIEMYKLANKRIIISPKKLISGVMPALVFSLIVALILSFVGVDKINSSGGLRVESASLDHAESYLVDEKRIVQEEIGEVMENERALNSWAWFLLGAWSALLVLVLWNIRREE